MRIRDRLLTRHELTIWRARLALLKTRLKSSALADFRLALEITEQRLRMRMNATMVERVLEIERRVEELEQKQR